MPGDGFDHVGIEPLAGRAHRGGQVGGGGRVTWAMSKRAVGNLYFDSTNLSSPSAAPQNGSRPLCIRDRRCLAQLKPSFDRITPSIASPRTEGMGTESAFASQSI